MARSSLKVLWVGEPDLHAGLRAPLARCLADHAAVGVREATSAPFARELSARVLAAKDAWTHDFGGEQFALGRAFYTHLETGNATAYFRGARESDELVERTLPGMQESALRLLARIVCGSVRRRPGFCGPGVHVFPSGGTVARRGGVVHFDLEGLTDQQLERRARAVTLVWMLSPAARGGGLRLFDALYDGRPDAEVALARHREKTVRARAGDALLIDSYRLHQIRPFEGAHDRVSITVHGAEIDHDVWEAWF